MSVHSQSRYGEFEGLPQLCPPNHAGADMMPRCFLSRRLNESGLLSPAQLHTGLGCVASQLDDLILDTPDAPTQYTAVHQVGPSTTEDGLGYRESVCGDLSAWCIVITCARHAY